MIFMTAKVSFVSFTANRNLRSIFSYLLKTVVLLVRLFD